MSDQILPQLLVIDALGILRRSLELSPNPDEDQLESALANTHRSIRRLLANYAPSHVICAFETAGTGWRTDLWPEYQSTWSLIPEMARSRIDTWRKDLDASGVPSIAVIGVEVRDMIATVASQWMTRVDGELTIVSNDKFLLPLLGSGCKIWDIVSESARDDAWVMVRYGVTPDRLPQLVALMGDQSHQIPGVDGVGVKTAAKLLNAYGSLDAVMTGAGILQDRIGAQLRKGRDLIAVSEQLASLRNAVHLGLTWSRLKYQAPI